MKTFFIKNRTVYSIAVLLTGIIFLGFMMQSCSSDDELSGDRGDDNIINSVELEEYIIAASDFKQSLAIFEKEINKVDFSKLEVSYDKDGRKITRLPASVASVGIEEKLQIFNEKKEALLEEYPQFASFTLDKSKTYFQQSIQNSLNVSSKLLELGINFYQPLLKGGTYETYNSQPSLLSFLSSWVNSPDYVEVFIIAYTNGSLATWIDSENTTHSSGISIYTKYNKHFTDVGGNSSAIVWVAHTHRTSSSAGAADIAFKNKYPHMGHRIYYNGYFHSY
jgi:hypothetical protein